MTDDHKHEHRRRDSESLLIMGAFLAVLAVLVLSALIHSSGTEAVVNAVAGIALLAIGLGAILVGLKLRKRPE